MCNEGTQWPLFFIFAFAFASLQSVLLFLLSAIVSPSSYTMASSFSSSSSSSDPTTVVLSTLSASLHPDTQSAAEHQLNQFSSQSGYGSILLTIAANATIAIELRQLAAVLLKSYITKHWDATVEEFIAPEISEEEKKVIRSGLPTLLSDPSSKIRTAISLIISNIGDADWPEKWPELLPGLIVGINGYLNGNYYLSEGSLRTLKLFAAHLDDDQLKNNLATLLPVLLQLLEATKSLAISTPDKNELNEGEKIIISCQLNALTIYQHLLICIQEIFSEQKNVSQINEQLIRPTLSGFLTYFHSILSAPLPSFSVPLVYGIKIEIIRCLLTLNGRYPDMLTTDFYTQFFPLSATLLNTIMPSYQYYYLNSMKMIESGENFEYNEEGDLIGIQGFIAELIEFIREIITHKSIKSVVKSQLTPLLYILISAHQISNYDMAQQLNDINVFITLEQDKGQEISIRNIAKELILTILENYGKEAIKSAVICIFQQLKESQELRAVDGNDYSKLIIAQSSIDKPIWWKKREAAVNVMTIVTGQITAKSGLDVINFLKNVLLPDLDVNNIFPYLRTAALHSLSSMIPLIVEMENMELLQTAFNALLGGLLESMPIHFRVTAMGTIGKICLTCMDEENKSITAILNSFLLTALPSMVSVLPHLKDESLLSALDTLVLLISSFSSVAQSNEAAITPPLLQSWLTNAKDPKVTSAVIEIIRTLSMNAQCLSSIHTRIFPVILSIIGNPKDNEEGLIVAAIDILQAIVDSHETTTDITLNPAYIQQVMPVLIQLLSATEEEAIITSGTTTLASFVRVGSSLISTDNGLITQLINVTSKLLSPSIPDQTAANVGQLITQLIFRLSAQLGTPLIMQILQASAYRLASSSSYPLLNEPLILLFARLVHANGSQVIDLLASLGEFSIQKKIKNEEKTLEKARAAGKKYATPDMVVYDEVSEKVNALQCVLEKWLIAHNDFSAVYPAKVSITALAKLISVDGDRLSTIPVQGYPIINPTPSAPVTRGKKAAGASLTQYTQIPFTVKVMSLLIHQWKDAEQIKAAAEKENNQKKNNQNKNKKKKEINLLTADDDEDDEEEGEEDDDEEDIDEEDAFIKTMIKKAESNAIRNANKSTTFAPAGKNGGVDKHWLMEKGMVHLDELLDNADHDDIEDDEIRELWPEALGDPINDIELSQYIHQFLETLSKDPTAAAKLNNYAAQLSIDDQKSLSLLMAATKASQSSASA